MKFSKIVTLASQAAASTSLLHRSQRDVGTISLTGEETPDDLQQIIDTITFGYDDDIAQAIEAFTGIDREVATEPEIRKFRQLKALVLWLQNEPKFGKYCYYGCYCLPEGSHDIASGGYGKPLDEIDQACFDFKQCYKCLLDEHKDEEKACAGEEFGYRAKLDRDSDGNNIIQCTNKPGSCRYNICQCDKALAEKLGKHQSTWNESYHTVKGGFERDQHCFAGQGGNHKFEECCGNKNTFPFNQPRRDHQCCDGVQAKDAGTC